MIGAHLDVPDSFRFSTAIAMCTTYDYEPSPRKDPIVSIVDNLLRVAVPAFELAKVFLVDAFPFCKSLVKSWK